MSPKYPNPYPFITECIYTITQPSGFYINTSLTTMDLTCPDIGGGSDYIEIRDGNLKDSPLMGKFCGNGSNMPSIMQTSQNNLRIR